VCPN